MTSLKNIREAHLGDLDQIITLLHDDELGKIREGSSDIPAYEKVFHAILSDPNHLILVIEEHKKLLGCIQLSYIPNITFKGSWRAQLEGMRIDSKHRGKGLGKQMIDEAIKRAIARDCKIVQLTTNNTRSKAIKFYKSLGFQSSHTGMKFYINN